MGAKPQEFSGQSASRSGGTIPVRPMGRFVSGAGETKYPRRYRDRTPPRKLTTSELRELLACPCGARPPEHHEAHEADSFCPGARPEVYTRSIARSLAEAEARRLSS